MDLPRGSGSLFLSGIHPADPDRLWFRVPGRGDLYGLLPARLWLSTDGAASFQQVAATAHGMLGFALSPDGSRLAFGGPLDGLFVAPANGSAAAARVSDLRVSCLRWLASGLYVCAGEPTDPYSLGFASEPTQGFVPLWRRADTCRETCAASTSLETLCREPWDAIAPLVGAESALCHLSVPTDTRAGSRAASPTHDAGPTAVPATDVADASQPSPPRSPRGCAATTADGANARWWLPFLLILARCHASRSSARRAGSTD